MNPHALGSYLNNESTQSRVEFKLTSNTNGTFMNNVTKDEHPKDDALITHNILD